MSYPVVEETKRPYRLWDAKKNQAMRWRYYSDPKRAHMGALIEVRWAKVGTVVEVYNASNGRGLGQYMLKFGKLPGMEPSWYIAYMKGA